MIRLATRKLVVSIPMTTDTARDFGPLPGDVEEYAKYVVPSRGGILSERRLRDKRITRDRLVRDSRALRYALRRATEEIVDLRSWGEHLKAKA